MSFVQVELQILDYFNEKERYGCRILNSSSVQFINFHKLRKCISFLCPKIYILDTLLHQVGALGSQRAVTITSY